MKLIIYLLLPLYSSFSIAATPWLAKISSTYTDQVTGQKSRVEGTGFLVACTRCEITEKHSSMFRYFIFTASHVSQGSDLEIELVEKSIKPKVIGRLADNLHDVEIFEIDSDNLFLDDILATFSKPEKKVLAGFRWHSNDARLYLTYPAGSEYAFTYKKSIWNSIKGFFNSSLFFVDQAEDPFYENTFIPIPPWVDRANLKKLTDNPEKKAEYNVSYVPFGNEFMANVQIAAGMSGAPLIRSYDIIDRNMIVDGIVSRRLRGFEQSYFISNVQMDNVFQRFLKEERGLTKDIRWNMLNGVTFRSLPESGSEIVSLSAAAGNGISSDGGNGLSSDGGSDKSKSFADLTSNLMGMMWKRKHVVGFRVSCRLNDKDYNFSIYANLGAVDFFETFKDICQWREILPLELDRDLLVKAGLSRDLPLVPVIKDKDQIIDIHEVFFVDLSMISVVIHAGDIFRLHGYEDNPDNTTRENLLHLLVELNKTPRVRVKPVK